MTPTTRQLILRAHALYLGTASVVSFFMLDIRGVYFGDEPLSRATANAPHIAIGFVEAHALAFILASSFGERPQPASGTSPARLLPVCSAWPT